MLTPAWLCKQASSSKELQADRQEGSTLPLPSLPIPTVLPSQPWLVAQPWGATQGPSKEASSTVKREGKKFHPVSLLK